MGALIFLFFFFYFKKETNEPCGSLFEKQNCQRCGRPHKITGCEYQHNSFWDICSICNTEYHRVLKKEIKKQKEIKNKVECDKCNGSGKIKGYRCENCKGRGFIIINEECIRYQAIEFLKYNSEWGKYSCGYPFGYK